MSSITHAPGGHTSPIAPTGDNASDAGAIFVTARLADYGRLADRLAILATSAHIVTRRHPEDINAAALLRELLALALDAHRASIAQDLHYLDAHAREVDAADWHDLDRMRGTAEALRHILARLPDLAQGQPLTLHATPASTPASTPEATPASALEAQQTARKRRPTTHTPATLDAPLASSVAPTRHRKGSPHA